LTYLDTHCAIWLRRGDISFFGKRARQIIETDDELYISPVVLLEIEMLHERKRLKASADQMLADLQAIVGVQVCNFPFPLIVEQALREKWTTEPGDRLITAHARVRQATLITRDQEILQNYDLALS